MAALDLRVLGQSWLAYWAHAAERAVAVRGTADAHRFHDVRYTDLVADPQREIRRLYDAAGLELTTTAQQRMERWLDRRHDRRRAHRYCLEQFGLDAGSVDRRFRTYGSL